MKLNIIYKIGLLTLFFVNISCSNPNDIDPPPPDVGFIEVDNVDLIPFDELLTLTQKQTFKYFWDFAEPVSGLAREDSERPNIITTGGSGFGIASFIVGIERGWVSREDVINRMDTVLNFLEEAEKYHGAFSHWYDSSGTVSYTHLRAHET